MQMPTISVINVTLKEASRFGIMNTKEDNIVYEFEEKPKKPKSTKALWEYTYLTGRLF